MKADGHLGEGGVSTRGCVKVLFKAILFLLLSFLIFRHFKKTAVCKSEGVHLGDIQAIFHAIAWGGRGMSERTNDCTVTVT